MKLTKVTFILASIFFIFACADKKEDDILTPEGNDVIPVNEITFVYEDSTYVYSNVELIVEMDTLFGENLDLPGQEFYTRYIRFEAPINETHSIWLSIKDVEFPSEPCIGIRSFFIDSVDGEDYCYNIEGSQIIPQCNRVAMSLVSENNSLFELAQNGFFEVTECDSGHLSGTFTSDFFTEGTFSLVQI